MRASLPIDGRLPKSRCTNSLSLTVTERERPSPTFTFTFTLFLPKVTLNDKAVNHGTTRMSFHVICCTHSASTKRANNIQLRPTDRTDRPTEEEVDFD